LSIRRNRFETNERRLRDQVYKDIEDQVYKDFKSKHTRTLIFSFQSNKGNVLEHIASIFSIYSID
jgi:hypothetical protein